MPEQIRIEVSERDLQRALARIAAYDSPVLSRRTKKVFVSAAKMLVGPMRRAAPRGGRGTLRQSIIARTNRPREAELAAATVGPVKKRAFHRHLVIRGHRIVTPGGKDTGRRTAANPFVDRVWDNNEARVMKFVTEQVVALGTTSEIA